MIKFRTGVKIRSGIKIGHSVSDNDMILVYAIPAPNTNIQLAIQANSKWFSDGQVAVINWGDGSNETVSDTGGSTYIGHKYASAGTYTIKISGSMTMYGRASAVDIAGQEYLTRVDSFGKLGITSFINAFYLCSGLASVPKTLPGSVTFISNMFQRCSGATFNPDVSNWDVSKVTTMSYMFKGCSGAAFRGGRGVDGIGIANWQLKTGTAYAVDMTEFMLSSKTQAPPFLDEILNAWAALHAQGLLPTNITVHFGTNNFTAAGVTAYIALTTNAGWTISSGGLTS